VLLSTWPNWWDDWQYQWKVTFDGEARTITINSGVTSLSVKEDIYSAWKQWAALRRNGRFPAALRTIGGDPLGDGKLAGDLYFLQNNWQVVVNELVSVEGALFNDLPKPAYDVQQGGGIISTVSNLVQTVETQASTTLTAQEISNAVWNEQIQDTNTALDILSSIPDNVWNEIIDGADQTAREKLRKIATKTQDIALR